MATYFKYAERSAESQINWAEVGKNMTDMLQEQERIRDEKISALDAATRELGEKLANPPQGEHKSANQWALEYGDNASEYMLMQEKLFKSGKMKTKDYLVSRQNLVDGTKQAFNLTKEFQETFKMKMDRYKNGESQDLELFLNAQAEKFGDFTKSQLYINPTDGSVNVAMKERRVIGGKEVFVMNQNPNEFTTISSLRNTIAGTYDKFDTNAVSTAFADSLGKEETASIVFGTLSKGGAITTEEDITSRTDLDADGKTIMFKFIDAENQFINASLENPYDRLSVLTNTKKFAPNGKQYTFTYDEADAKANPEKVLLKVDSATGQPTPQFNDEQMKVSTEAMRTEVRAKYDYKKGISPTSQAQLQESRPRTEAEMGRADKIKDAENFGRQLGRALKSTDVNERDNAIKYLAQKSGRQVEINGGQIMVYDLDGKGKSPFNLNDDPNKIASSLISAFGVDLPEDTILKFSNEEYKGNRTNTSGSVTGIVSEPKPESVQVLIPITAIEMSSTEAAASIQEALPANFTAKDLTPGAFSGNQVKITAPNGKTFTINTKLTGEKAENTKGDLEKFIKLNNVAKPKEDAAAAGAGQAGGTGNLNASNRKPK